MLDTFMEMMSYPFMVRAFLVGSLVALCSALLGVSLVLKRYSMIGDGLSHVGFGALAIAAALNRDGLGRGCYHRPGLAITPVDDFAFAPGAAVLRRGSSGTVELGGDTGQERPVPLVVDVLQRHDHDALLVPGRRTHRAQFVAAGR